MLTKSVKDHIKKIDMKKLLIHKLKKFLMSLFRIFLILGLGYVILYPLLYMLSKAFSLDFMHSDTVVWIPRQFGLDNIKLALEYLKYPQSLSASLRIGLISAVLQVISCSAAGYAFARFELPGKKLLFGIVILTIIVPPQTYLVPSYMEYRFFDVFGLTRLFSFLTGGEALTFNLLNTEWTFWLPSMFGVGLRSGLFIYIFRQFYAGMPRELENAAKIDGCGHIRTYISVMLPNALTSCLTVFLFSVVWHWNDYFVSSMFLQTDNVPLMVNLFRAADFQRDMVGYQGHIDMQYVYSACALLVVLPPLILYAFAQKYFLESVTTAGIKG